MYGYIMALCMPQDHQQSKPAAFKDKRLGPSVVWKTKVTDKVSKTAVGSLSRRVACSTKQELLEQKADKNRRIRSIQSTPELIEDTPQGGFTTYWIWNWIRLGNK
jgi:hypothetical protein